MEEKKKIWFRRKWFGWGWYPASVEGWIVTMAYIILVIIFASTLDDNSTRSEAVFTFFLPLVLLTVTFLKICYYRGEKPRWQWGKKSESDNKTWEESETL